MFGASIQRLPGIAPIGHADPHDSAYLREQNAGEALTATGVTAKIMLALTLEEA